MKRSVCFFIQTNDPELISRNEFYKIDIKILQDLGFEVRICQSYKSLPDDVDFFFIWWWTYAIFPILKAKRLKKKSIITGTFNLAHHVKGGDYYSRPFHQRFLIRTSACLTDMNIMVSNFEFERIKQEITKKNVSYSPHVLDIEKYDTKKTQKRNKNIFTIAWMGNLNARRKCIPEIINAASILKKLGHKIPFLIAGKIDEEAQFLIELTKELEVSDIINFLGPIDEKTKIDLLHTCGIYLQPTQFEGFGLAIAEAMLCEAPVITSKVGAVPEITNDHCLYVDGKNPERISEGILKIFRDHKLYIDNASIGRKFVEKNFNYHRRKNDIENILNQLQII